MTEKYPWLKLYVGDWLSDEKLGQCSPATRGIWFDAIVAMHKNGRTGTLEGTAKNLARVCRCTEDEFLAACRELKDTGTADVALHVTQDNGKVTLENRRMKREEKVRQQTRLRVDKHRKQQSNAKETPNVTVQKSEVRSQKSEKEGSGKKTTPKKFDPLKELLPPNVKPELWEAWIEHLREKKKPPTKRAVELQLKKLAKLPNANETIEHSIEHNWQGLYPPDKRSPQSSSELSLENQRLAEKDQESNREAAEGARRNAERFNKK